MERAGGKSGLVRWMMVAAGIWMLLPLVESATYCADTAGVDIPCPMNALENLTCSYIRGRPAVYPTPPPNLPPDYPGSAIELKVQPYLKYDSNTTKCDTYLNITWKISPFGCSSLQGYLLNVTFPYNGGQVNIYRTYSVSVGVQTSRDLLLETALRHECIIPLSSTPYQITVHSLPVSSWKANNSVSTVYTQTGPATTMPYCDKPDNPDMTNNWVATMWSSQSSSENTGNASLEVCFFLAPVVFGFNKYRMSLMNTSTSILRETIAQRDIYDNGTQENRKTCVTFDKVCPGTYRVELTPDPGIRVYGSTEPCPCRVGPRPEDCIDICTTTALEPIDMTNSVCVPTTTAAATTTTVAVVPPLFDNPVTSPPHDSKTEPPMTSLQPEPTAEKASSSAGKIAGIVVGLVLAIVLVGITAIFLLAHFRRRRSEKCPVLRLVSYQDGEQISTLPKRHRVLLVYSTDNESHRKVIRSFAAFLHACCGCDVLYDEWSQMEIAQTNPIDWLSKQMYGVKQVVVVNSLGAYEQHRGWIEQKPYAPSTNLLLPDVFIPAIRQVQSKVFQGCPQFRCYNVCFPYTDQKHILDLSGGKCYKLMDHIEDLFLHIHGLAKFTPRGTTSADQINAANYHLTKEGMSLRKAIEEATDFARENPNWFQSYYRRDQDGVTDNNNSASPRDDLHLYTGAGSSPVTSSGTAEGGSDSSSIGTASDIVYFAPSSCSGDDIGGGVGGSATPSPDAGLGGMGEHAVSSSSIPQPKFLLFDPQPPEDMDGDDTSSIGSRYVVAKINELNDQYDSGLSSLMQDLTEVNLHGT